MTSFECAVKIATVTPVGFSNGLYPFSTLVLDCQRAVCNQQTMQISRFINRFDDCKKICPPNMWVRWQHSCSNAGPIMIDNLFRTSPEMVT